jgi:hypothetical protein
MTLVLSLLVGLLVVLNIYQFLVSRTALCLGEVLFVMSNNVREKAAEVRREQKDIEIIEAHLLDLTTSARGLLKALGRGEKTLGPDPALTHNGVRMDADSLVRMADNVFYSVTEETPNAGWDETMDLVLDRFIKKVPFLERPAARKIVEAVAQDYKKETGSPWATSAKG